MGKRLTPEQWIAIETEWRTGSFSNVELGRKYGVNEKAIRKRAIERGWTRNLGDAADARADRKMLDAPAPKPPKVTTPKSDASDHSDQVLPPRSESEVRSNPYALIEESIIEEMAGRRATANLAALSRADDLKKVRNKYHELIVETMSGDSLRMTAAAPILFAGTGGTLGAAVKVLASVDESIQKVERLALGMDREAKRVQISGPDGGAIKTESKGGLDITKLTTEQLAALASINVAMDDEDKRKGPPMPPGDAS